ncbi:hypothetical protein MMC17_002753 [Xylographa soralifera]|nr:hypothetical protein [Xylographa soralifera]
MERLAVASGIIAVVSLAGQVLSGLLFLDGFFGDVSDAPEHIQLLRREIELLKVIIRAFSWYDTTVSTPSEEDTMLNWGPLLEMCGTWVGKLETAMRKFEAKLSKSRVQRHWRDIVHALSAVKN